MKERQLVYEVKDEGNIIGTFESAEKAYDFTLTFDHPNDLKISPRELEPMEKYTVAQALDLIDYAFKEKGITMTKICRMIGITLPGLNKWKHTDETQSVKPIYAVRLLKLSKYAEKF